MLAEGLMVDRELVLGTETPCVQEVDVTPVIVRVNVGGKQSSPYPWHQCSDLRRPIRGETRTQPPLHTEWNSYPLFSDLCDLDRDIDISLTCQQLLFSFARCGKH